MAQVTISDPDKFEQALKKFTEQYKKEGTAGESQHRMYFLTTREKQHEKREKNKTQKRRIQRQG